MLRQAQHERGGVVHRLQRHPDTPACEIVAVDVEWLADDLKKVSLTFVVTGAKAMVVPGWASPVRADELWRTSCFELFWQEAGTARYVELNLSPSTQWAAYSFDGYRSGMVDHPMDVAPHIVTKTSDGRLTAQIDLDFGTFPGHAARVGLCAVIEEINGTKSYWALAHPPGAPDFHHADCFALELPAANAA